MKILYIHQYFRTPEESGATRSYWFSKKLVENGIDVTVISAKKQEGRFNYDGIDVIYVKNDYSQNFSTIKKIKLFFVFLLKAINEGVKQKNVDLIYATSTPLTVGVIALALKKIKGWRYVFEVRDLWPEFPIQIGAIKNRVVIKFLRWIEKVIYHEATHVVALSPGMAEGVYKCGISHDKVTVIPNMSKCDLFSPRERTASQYEKYGIENDKFNVLHAGHMGVANGVDYIIDTATVLQKKYNEDSICFVFAGSGSQEKKMKELVKQRELRNVRFLGGFNTEGISNVMNLCDMSVVTFKNLPILYTNSPNKLFDSLSAGLPTIVNSAGWTKGIVEDGRCGFYVDPENPEDMATKLLNIKDDKIKLREMSENARKVALEKFDKSILTEKFYEVIREQLKNIQVLKH